MKWKFYCPCPEDRLKYWDLGKTSGTKINISYHEAIKEGNEENERVWEEQKDWSKFQKNRPLKGIKQRHKNPGVRVIRGISGELVEWEQREGLSNIDNWC